jgi:hypothetical protein
LQGFSRSSSTHAPELFQVGRVVVIATTFTAGALALSLKVTLPSALPVDLCRAHHPLMFHLLVLLEYYAVQLLPYFHTTAVIST